MTLAAEFMMHTGETVVQSILSVAVEVYFPRSHHLSYHQYFVLLS